MWMLIFCIENFIKMMKYRATGGAQGQDVCLEPIRSLVWSPEMQNYITHIDNLRHLQSNVKCCQLVENTETWETG